MFVIGMLPEKSNKLYFSEVPVRILLKCTKNIKRYDLKIFWIDFLIKKY